MRRPEVELGPERSLMEVGGLRAQLIGKVAIGAEFRKPQVECRLASEIRGNVHDRLAKSAALRPRGLRCAENRLGGESALLYVRKTPA